MVAAFNRNRTASSMAHRRFLSDVGYPDDCWIQYLDCRVARMTVMNGSSVVQCRAAVVPLAYYTG